MYIQSQKNQNNFGMVYLIEAFDRGNKKIFFEGWRRLLPMHIQANVEIFLKLEFYLQIYFAIFSMLGISSPGGDQKKLRDGLDEFKEYLRNKSEKLSRIPKLLSFYALPFVPSPQTHISFKHIFTKHWATKLRHKLNLFLSRYLFPLDLPQLCENYRTHNEFPKKENFSEATAQNIVPVCAPAEERIISQEMERFRNRVGSIGDALIISPTKWTVFFKNILAVSDSLSELANSNQRGDEESRKRVLNTAAEKIKEYVSFLSTNGAGPREIGSEFDEAMSVYQNCESFHYRKWYTK